MPYINYRILEFSTALTLGILLSYWLPMPMESFLLLFLGWSYLLFRFHSDRNRFLPSKSFPVVTYSLFVLIGYWSYQFDVGIYKSESHALVFNSEKPSLWILKLETIGKSDTITSRFNAQILGKGNDKIKGQVYLTIKRGDSFPKISTNDVLVVYGKLKRIESPPNPYQFDFAHYMAQKGIYFSMTLEEFNILKIQKGKKSLAGLAEELRYNLTEKFENTPLDTNVKAITQALTLGDRTDIDAELYDAYSKAGAVHILAVSGLHIGIIMLFLNQLFSFLLRFPKGRFLRTVFVVVILWGFALLTGFSPSVVRAVGMFSLFCLGDLSDRSPKGINTMFLAFFITLILVPSWLFHLGFQLSYLAVGSILLIQPKLYKVWIPRFWPIRKAWEIFTVGFAAQLGVAPLSMFYFHQFPGLFWLTNWILLPLLSILLIYAFMIVFISSMDWTPLAVFDLYNFIVSAMNYFIAWVASQDSFLWRTGNISISVILVAYAFLIGFVVSKQHLLKSLSMLTLGFLLFIKAQSLVNSIKSTQQLIWFHAWGESCLVMESHQKIKVFRSVTQKDIKNPLKSYLQSAHKPIELVDSIPRIFRFQETTYLVIDRLGIYPKLTNSVVLLTGNPKVHLERMVEELQPKLIIADGSNYMSHVQKWEKNLKNLDVPFWHTYKVAYIQKMD